MKKSYILYGVGVFVILFGLSYLLFTFGVGPKAVPVLKLSGFTNGQELGSVIYQRFFVETSKAPLLIFGGERERPKQAEAVLGFIQAAQSEGKASPTIILDESFKDYQPIFESAALTTKIFRFPEQRDELVQYLKSESPLPQGSPQAQLEANHPVTEGQKQNVILFVPTVFSSHLPKQNLAKDLEQEFKQPLYSFSFLSFAKDSTQEKKLAIPCSTSAEDLPTYGQLGCMALSKSRQLYRKKKPQKDFWGTMDRMGATDFIVYTSF